ncbi:hypothetical protein IAD21_01476 [Abditibacteriota bacterium]|nr:hypothetical protein IAD21_01476 [Abditibacteriota bacterium]
MSPQLLKIRRRVAEASLLGIRAALASCAAVAIAQSLNLTYPLYAVVAAVIVTDVSSEKTQQSGVQRLLGTAVGSVSGPLLVLGFGHSLVVVGVAIALLIFLCYVVGYIEAAKLAGYVAGLVVLDHSDAPWAYARDRFVETSLGIVLAIVVSLLIPERPLQNERDDNESNTNVL